MNGSKGQRGSHGGTGSAATTATTPVYSCFDSTHALILGYPSATIQELKAKIEEGGGSVSIKLSSRQPQIIICGSTYDKAFREAKKQPLLVSIPVVTQDWVAQCVSVNKQVSYDSYVLKPLAGTHICITNFGSYERDQIQKQVEAAGAAYTAELHKDRCTHLVCKIANGPKYKAACGWRTCHVVTLAWVVDSLKLGCLAPEEQYRPPPAPEGATAAQAAASAVQGGPAAPPAPLQGQGFYTAATRISTSEATSNTCQQQQQEAATADTIAQQQHASATAAAATAAVASTGRATRASSRSRVAAAAAASGGNHSSGVTLQQQQEAAQAAAAAAAAAADAAETAPMLLERVVMWWCGLPPVDSPEYLELQHILHLYAGVRFPDLCDATTHIMIGTKASKAELQAVGQFLQAARRRLEVVTPQWLHLCHQEQRLVTDTRHKLSTRDVLQYAGLGPGAAAAAAGGAAAAAGALTAAGSGSIAGGVFSSMVGGGDSNAGFPWGTACGITGGVFAKSASRHGFPAITQEQQQQQEAAAAVPEYWAEEHQPRDPDKVFEDSWFTVAALQSDEHEHKKALDLIRRYGGKVFKADSVKPPPRHPKVFAVCPPSLPAEAEQELMRDASFRAADPSCRVTMQWMELCVQRKELVRITQRMVLSAPLRHKLPLQGFEAVRVFITGYEGAKRRTIAALVQLLGGRMCETAKKGVTTHLILPRWGPDDAGDGRCDLTESSIKKVHWASRYNVQMVASEWLLECAHAGKKLGEDFFRPEGKLELLPAPTATQAMISQLGPTQLPGNTQAPAVNRHPAAAAPASSKCPLPSQPHRLANTATAAAAAAAAAAGQVSVAGGSALTPANRMEPAAQPQQQQQQHKQQQQQPSEQQQQRPRRRLPGSCSVTAEEPDIVTTELQQHPLGKQGAPQWQQPQQQDQRQEQDQLQQQQYPPTTARAISAVQPSATAAAATTAAAAAPAVQPAAATAATAAPATAAEAATAVAASAAEAAALKLAASPLAESEGDDVLANVEGLLKTVNTLASSTPVDASQQMMAADMLQHMEFTGRVASGGAAATCSAGSGGSGHTLRNKRKAAAGAGSGHRGSVEPEGCLEGAGSGGNMSGPAAAAKRHRRSTTAAGGSGGPAGAGAMPPPARVAPGSRGAAAAGSGAAAAGSGGPGASGGGARGSRFSTRRAAAGTPTDVVEMSQQVGYDVDDHPELLLAASGRRRGGSAANEAGVKDEMLARLTRLKSTG